MTQENRKYVESLLDTLKAIDRSTHEAYYEMGRILHALKNDALYKVLGYTSFRTLVEEELSYSYSVAITYSRLYKHLRRLKYNKTDSLELLENFGLRRLSRILPKINEKLGTRAMRNRVDALDDYQMTFWMHGFEYDEVSTALEACGALYTETGRFANSSEALIAMARKINGTAGKKAA